MAYTRLQRSINARKQLRDRKGRWIFMGGSIKFRFGGKDRSGTINGFDGEYVSVSSKNPDTGKTETIRKHRSEIESTGGKASISRAQSRSRAKKSDTTPPEGLHNDDESTSRRLSGLGINSDDSRKITGANSRDEAESAWTSSEGGKAADARYAEIKDKPALSSSEKAFKTRYENTKNSIAERFQSDSNEIYEDGLGNTSIPKDRLDSKSLKDLSEGDKILGKGERNSPEVSKSGDRDKTNGEILEVTEKSTDDSGNTTLKVRDEDGNEREYKYNKKAGDKAEFAEATSLYEPTPGDDDDSSADDPLDISDWKILNPGERDAPIRMEDEFGDEFFAKGQPSNLHALNDAVASRLYTEAGIRSATQEPAKRGDSNMLTVSPAIPDAKDDAKDHVDRGDKEYLDDLREGFAIDAWLGNSGVTGEYFDNIMTDSNGQPVRVSQSGALMFDADDKERPLKNSVTEWNSMRRGDSPAAQVFKGMSVEQMKDSARRVASFSDADIDRVVDNAGMPETTAEPLKKTLKARRDDIKKRAGLDTEEARETAPQQSDIPEPARKAPRRAERAQEDTAPPADDESPAEGDEPADSDLPADDDVPLDDDLEEVSYEDEIAAESDRLRQMRKGTTVRSDEGDEYTRTSVGERDAWSDESGNEIGDSDALAEIGYGSKLRRLDSNGDVVPEDRDDSTAPTADDADADIPEGLTDNQRAQAEKVSGLASGATVTDDDGIGYVKNEDGDWEREDGSGLVGDDEALAEYVGDQSLNVDENNPDNRPFNPNVKDSTNYRPYDEDGNARDRTPEEQEMVDAAKDAEPGDTFVDSDGDEYIKGENDKWSPAGAGDDEGFHNSEHFIAARAPWTPTKKDSGEGDTDAPETPDAEAPDTPDAPPAPKAVTVDVDGEKIRLSPAQQSVLSKAAEASPKKISADRLKGISQSTLNTLTEKGLLKESGNVYSRSFEINDKGRKANDKLRETEAAPSAEPTSPRPKDHPTTEEYDDLKGVETSDYLGLSPAYRSKDGEIILNEDDYGWQVWTKVSDSDARNFRPGAGDERAGTVNGGNAQKVGDDVYINTGGGSRYDDVELRDMKDVANQVSFSREQKARDEKAQREINESVRQAQEEDRARQQEAEEATPEPAPARAPGESVGKKTSQEELDAMPEGSRIQIDQNNKTRRAVKGEDGKWRDEDTDRVIAKPVPKNANVSEVFDDTPEIDDDIADDGLAESLDALPSGSMVEVFDGSGGRGQRLRKNDAGDWVDESGNSRSSDEIADSDPENAIVDRVGSTPSQDKTDRESQEAPGQGDLFDDLTPDTERAEDGRATDSDLPGDSGGGTDPDGRGDDSGDGPLGFKSTGKAPAHGRESAIQEEGGSTPDLHEVDPADAGKFRDAISKLKDTKYGAAAHVYDEPEYASMRMFMNESGTAGYALNGDEIVSVFSLPENPDKGVGRHLIASAVGQGGTRLSAFDTVLPKLYAKEGFKPVARTKWDDANAPEGWDKETFKDYNGGEPDVVFMRHDPDSIGKSYDKSEGDYVDAYDEGVSVARGDSSMESMSTDDLDKIKMDAIQNEDYVNELAEQLKNIGLGENDYIIVEDSDSGPFMTDGHHLLQAAKKAGISSLPVKRFANTEEGRLEALREINRLEAAKQDGTSRLREYAKPEKKDSIADILGSKPGDSIAIADGEYFTKDEDGRWYDVSGESISDGQLNVRLRGKEYEKIDAEAPSAPEQTPEAPEAPSTPERPSEGQQKSDSLRDAEPGTAIQSDDGEDFFVKDEDGAWFDDKGNAFDDSDALAEHLGDRSFTPVGSEKDSPAAEELEDDDVDIPTPEEIKEKIEAFDPEDEDTAEAIDALDGMARGTTITQNGMSFTKMQKYWKHNEYPSDAPKSGNRYTSEDVLLNVDLNDALVTDPAPSRPKPKKEFTPDPSKPELFSRVQTDEFGNEFIENGSGTPIYKGDNVKIGGKNPLVGTLEDFSPDGDIAKIRDNVTGKIKSRKANSMGRTNSDDDGPDLSGDDTKAFDDAPTGTKITNDDLAANDEFLEKNADGIWEHKTADGKVGRELTSDELREADWNYHNKKATDDRREASRKEREAEQREEERIRKKEEAEETKRRKAEEAEEKKILDQIEKEETKRLRDEKKAAEKEVNDWLKSEEKKDAEAARKREKEARDELKKQEKDAADERDEELKKLKEDILARDKDRTRDALERQKEEERDAREKRAKEMKELRDDIIERNKKARDEQRQKDADDRKAERDRDRMERDAKKEKARQDRQREKDRKDRERRDRDRRKEDEDEKKKKKKKKRRPDPEGGGGGFPGGFPGGFGPPGAPKGGKPKAKKPKAPAGGGGSGPGGGPTGPGNTPASPTRTQPSIPITPVSRAENRDLRPDTTPDLTPEDGAETTPEGRPDAQTPTTRTPGGEGDDGARTGITDRSGDSDEGGGDQGTDSRARAVSDDSSDRTDDGRTRYTGADQLARAPIGTLVAKSDAYDAPMRKVDDGVWLNLATGKALTDTDIADTEDDSAWDEVSSAVKGVLLDDSQGFDDAPFGTIVAPGDGSIAEEGLYQKQSDGSWQPIYPAGDPMSADSIDPQDAHISLGPAIVDSAPQAALTRNDTPEGYANILSNSREQMSEVSAPASVPETEHMKWVPGQPVSTISDFENAVQGTVLRSDSEPAAYYQKGEDGRWVFMNANGSTDISRAVTPAQMASDPLGFVVDTPSTTAGMQFPVRALQDKGELDFLPALAIVSEGDPADGAPHYTKNPDGSWRFVPARGTYAGDAQRTITPQEFARVIAEGRLTAYPTSALQTTPEIGAQPTTVEALRSVAAGTILTDGTTTDGNGRVFHREEDGTWTLYDRAGAQQADGLSDADVAGVTRTSGVLTNEPAPVADADELPVGARIFANDAETGVRGTFAKTGDGRWARLDGNGNPVWPELSQEGLFDTVDTASMSEFSRPRMRAGEPTSIADMKTSPVGSRVRVQTPEGTNIDLIKTGDDEWSGALSRTPIREDAIARTYSPSLIEAVAVGNGTVDDGDGVAATSERPTNSVRSLSGESIVPGSYVSDPDRGISGIVEGIVPGSGDVIVRDAVTGNTVRARGQRLTAIQNSPTREVAQATGEDVVDLPREITPPSTDPTSAYYGQERPQRPETATFDGPFVDPAWSNSIRDAFEAMTVNDGIRFEDSPFAPIVDALATRGDSGIPFAEEGGRRFGDGSTMPTDAFGFLESAGLSSAKDTAAARAGFAANVARATESAEDAAGALSAYEDEVSAWAAANGVSPARLDAEMFSLKGIGGEARNYMIATDYWMDSTFVSVDEMPDHVQDTLRYVFSDLNSDVVNEIRTRGASSLEASYDGYSNETAAVVEALDESIAMSSFMFDTRVIQTAKLSDFTSSEIGGRITDSDVSSLVGTTIVDYGYMTPSVDTQPVSNASTADVMVYMRVPSGYSGLWVGGKNAAYGPDSAREVVLPRGTRMFVHRVGGMNGNMRELYAEVVPNEWLPEASDELGDD